MLRGAGCDAGRQTEEWRNVSLRLASRFGVVLAAAAAGLAVQALGGAAHAQGRLDARYTASLAGMPIGRGAWVVDIGEDKYLAAASGVTAGLLRLFSGGEGTGAARGSIVKGEFVPASYAASISTSSRRTNEVRFALKGGAVKDVAVSPPVPPDSGRIPLKAAHRRGVTDPMTASLLRVAGANPLVPGACQRSLAVFDGRMRYDLRFAYKRTETVRAEKGYAGPALVCAVYFNPVAGYIPDRTVIKYLTDSRDMEIWLTPIAGTSVLVPFRATVPTPFGLGVVEAKQYVTAAGRTRAATSGSKTQ
jgi:hypothetical protein